MNDRLSFRRAVKDDIPAIIQLISQRIDWMDEKGIDQWNNTNYLEVYPLTYFEEKIDFYLVAECDGRIVAAGAFYTEDARWKDNTANAYYVHHLTAGLNCKGAGSLLLEYGENEARENGIEYMRLDSDINNRKLENWYTERGYYPCGTCVDGLYTGILREKKLFQNENS